VEIDTRYFIAALQEELARVNENRVYLLALVKQLTEAQLASSLDRAMQNDTDPEPDDQE